MIRDARISDFPGMMRLGERLHAMSPYAHVPIDTLACSSTVGNCINSAFGFAVVATKKDEITGVMLGAAVPLWFSKKRSATDIITYAESPGDGVRMVRRFIDWAWSVPQVEEITIAQSSGIDTERTARLYQRLGLEQVGALFVVTRKRVSTEVAA